MMFCMRATLKTWLTLLHWRLESNLKSDPFWTASTGHETDHEKVAIKIITLHMFSLVEKLAYIRT